MQLAFSVTHLITVPWPPLWRSASEGSGRGLIVRMTLPGAGLKLRVIAQ